jgi:hypothetical protein
MKIRKLTLGLLTVLLGPVLAILLLVGFCGVASATGSSWCGHNAPIWIPFFLPIGIFICWWIFFRLLPGSPRRELSELTHAKCAYCDAVILPNAAHCPQCGRAFGQVFSDHHR